MPPCAGPAASQVDPPRGEVAAPAPEVTPALGATLPPALVTATHSTTPARSRHRLFSFTARDAVLRDVIDPLARELGLNVRWEPGVNAETQVSVAFTNTTPEEALQSLFAGTEYFFQTEGDQLEVRRTMTRTFELGYVPARIGSEMQVGGDVLGQLGGEGDGPKGRFEVKGSTDEKSADLWTQIEDALRFLISESGRFSINRLSGTVLVTDQKSNLKQIEMYLDEMRASLSRQVVVDVKVVEVGLDKRTATGVDWAALVNATTRRGSIRIAGSQNLSLPNSVVQLAVTGTDGEALINALGEQGQLDVLSQPRLNILNGQTAVINVGRVIAFWELKGIPGGSLGGQGVVVPEQKSVLAGILLGVTPYIATDGFVTMQIVPIITDLGETQIFEFQGTKLQAPNLDIRGSSTVVGVQDGETIVLGGLLSSRKKSLETKVPLLGDIPLLGGLFRRRDSQESKVELALLLTPRVVNRK
jgi:MSHA biogenesis protein MshL